MESHTRKELIEWLLHGDPAIQYQAQRDLLQNDDQNIQARIAKEGWGARFLAQRGAQTPQHWGQRFYQPKWISTHYTLLDLKHLQIKPHVAEIQETLNIVLTENIAKDGGISLGGDGQHSDACVNGMILNYACYFGVDPSHIQSLAACLLDSQLSDGGFNCNYNSKGARHSSMHSTISILEGFAEYEQQGYRYRLPEILEQSAQAREFLLQHRLYKSDHTGQVIKHGFTMLSFPSRWFYDVLRALVYFAENRIAFDPRMDDALNLLQEKRRKDGRWPLQAKHAGQVHFDMESAGKASRWNTLRALRVFDFYRPGFIN
jgi:hypothetical protein